MRTRTFCAAVFAASLGCCIEMATATATEPPQEAATAKALVQCLSAKAEQESFSGVISVTHHDQPVAFIARGVLAGSGSAPITAATRFNLASMGKMFTAVAIGQLVDTGKIRMDDPVGKYVSGLTPEASVVTVRQLLTHSSGLGNFFKPQNMEAVLKAKSASDLLPLIASDKPSFPPGSKFGYSNSGFALLGILVERVSGQHYADYLREHIFLPAGMADTGLSPEPLATLAVGMTAFQGGPPPAQAAASVAKGTAAELQPVPGATEGIGSPAGGGFSTAADMQRFADALLEDKLLSAATRIALTSSQIVAFPAKDGKPELSYGMGFGVGSESGKRWFGHNGGAPGANVEFAEFPDDQWTLAVFSNRDPPVASNMFRYLKDMLFKPDALRTCATAASN
ncbi:MAG TPA: serine hydrolase domain-containing protein [Xanthomonadaceae bacterium]|jgi:D-alanyl-D-alanine carboxypeptidase|nr:serine hydrolase domain-containing protein [Xanthomonadaceae bacterium]